MELIENESSRCWGITLSSSNECRDYNILMLQGFGKCKTYELKKEWLKGKCVNASGFKYPVFLEGEGIWSWLSLFTKDIEKTLVDISYSTDVGERRGSWKGGAIHESMLVKDASLYPNVLKEVFDKHKLEIVED